MSERFEELRRLLAQATPGEWETDTVKTEDGHGPYLTYEIKATDIPLGLADLIVEFSNSTLAEVHTDFDEDGATSWDETARRNAAFIVGAKNQIAEVLAALDAAEAEVAQIRKTLGPEWPQAKYWRRKFDEAEAEVKRLYRTWSPRNILKDDDK